jgi:RNA polymerase sigma factor (sigma-70 family)
MKLTVAERNRLLVDNLALVAFFVRHHRVLPALRNDAMQAGALGFLKALSRYDPEHPSGASLSAYAGPWISTYMLRAITAEIRRSDTDELGEAMLVEIPDDELLLERQNIGRYFARLPALQRTIVRERMQERTLEEIGQRLSPPLSRERVRQLERSAYAQIRHLARHPRGTLAQQTRLGP